MATIPAPINGDLDQRACEKKSPYSSELNARIAAQSVITDRNRATPHRMWVYTCPHCSRWHMTAAVNKTPAVTASELVAGSGR